MKHQIHLDKKSLILSLLLAMAITLALPQVAQATDLYWDTISTAGLQGGDGTFSATVSLKDWGTLAGNTATVAWTAGANAFFQVGSAKTYTVNIPASETLSIGNMTVDNANIVTFKFGASNGTLSYTANSTVSVNGASTLIWNLGSSLLTGTPALTLAGNSTLTFFCNAGGAKTLNYATLTMNTGNTLETVNGSGAGAAAFAFTSLSGSGGTINMSRGTDTFTVNNTDSSSFGGVISGAGSLTKSGSGTLTLSGNNTYTGGTTISGGTLSIATGGTINNGASINVGGASGANLTLNGGTVISTLSGNSALVIGGLTTVLPGTVTISSGNMSITGGVTMGGSSAPGGASTFNQSGGTFYTGGNVNVNNYGGASVVTVSGGTFTQDGAGTFRLGVRGVGTLTINSIDGGGYATLGTLQLGFAGQTGTGWANLDGGTMKVNNIVAAGSGGTINFNGGTLIANASFTPTSTLNTVVKSGGAIIDTLNNTLTISSALVNGTGGGGLTKYGAGTLILTGANTYTGATVIDGGTLVASADKCISASSPVTIRAGGVLRVNSVRGIDAGGSVTINNGGLMFIDNNAVNVRLDLNTVDMSGGTITGAANSGTYSGLAGAGSLTINVHANATASTIDTVRLQGDANTGSGVLTLSVDSGAQANVGSGIVNGGGGALTSLVKTGIGTLTLSGVNTYTGNTTVSAGTLTVTSAGALYGTGSISVPAAVVTVKGGATLRLAGWSYGELGGLQSLARGSGTIVLGDATTEGIIEYVGTGNPDAKQANRPLTISAGGGRLKASNSSGTWYVGSATDSEVGNLWISSAGGTLTLTGTGTGSMAGKLPGIGGLVKTDTGKWTITCVSGYESTYTGGTTINAGTLSISGSGSIGSGALTFAGGAFQIANNLTFANAATINNAQTGTIDVTSGKTGTLSGNFGTTTGALAKSGTGTLTLSGSSAYTGDTTVNGGTLYLTSGQSGGYGTIRSRQVYVNNGTTLQLKPESFGYNAFPSIHLDGSAMQFDTYTSLPSDWALNYIRTITMANGATVTLSSGGANAYGDDTTRRYQIWSLGTITSYASALQNTISSAGGYIPAGVTINVEDGDAATDLSISAQFGNGNSTPSGLTKAGAGLLELSGVNTYTGGTTLSGGTLALGNNSVLSASGTVTIDSVTATFNVNGHSQTIGALVGASGGTVSLGTGALTVSQTAATSFNGVITGAGSLTKTGVGALTLSGANTYMGATTIRGGTLALGAADRLSDSSAVIINASTATFDLGTYSDTVSSFAMSAGSLNGVNGTLTAARYSLTGGTVNAHLGSGTVTVSTAGVTLVSAGRLDASSTLALNSGTLTLGGAESVAAYTQSGGVLDGNGITITSTGGYALSGGTVTANLGAGTVTVTGNVSLNGTESGTTVSITTGAILTLGAANRLADDAVVTISGGTLNLNGKADTIGSLSGNGAVTLGAGALTTGGSGNTTFSGEISGTGSVTKQGGGMWTLTGNNSYSGGTTISGGTLLANSGSATGSGNVTVGGSATLGGNGTLAGRVTVNNGGTLAPGVAGSPVTMTIGGSLSFASGSHCVLRVAGSSSHDLIVAGGNVTLGGATLSLQTSGFDMSTSGLIPLISGTVSGTTTFGGLSEGSLVTLPNGEWQIKYNNSGYGAVLVPPSGTTYIFQ